MTMLKSTIVASALALAAAPALAQDNPMVGGAPMYADKNIVENAVNSADHADGRGSVHRLRADRCGLRQDL